MIVWHRSAPSGLRSPLRFAIGNHHFARAISCRGLRVRVQALKERHQRSSLCWTQVVSIRGHIATALDYLPNELVLREPHRDAIQGGGNIPAYGNNLSP